MATNFNDVVENPGNIYTNPVESTAKVTNEFIDPPSPEKSNRVTGVNLKKKQSTTDFFNNFFNAPVPVDQNSLDATLGFLTKKGFNQKSAEPIAQQILAIAYYSKKPVWYWLDQLALLPDTTTVNLKIMQVLNSTTNGNFYLGIKSTFNTNPYINRLLIK